MTTIHVRSLFVALAAATVAVTGVHRPALAQPADGTGGQLRVSVADSTGASVSDAVVVAGDRPQHRRHRDERDLGLAGLEAPRSTRVGGSAASARDAAGRARNRVSPDGGIIMSSIRVSWAAVALILAGGGELAAHYTYIVPQAFRVDSGATVIVGFHSGDGFPESTAVLRRLREPMIRTDRGAVAPEGVKEDGRRSSQRRTRRDA
jgi:hypothetical protein